MKMGRALACASLAAAVAAALVLLTLLPCLPGRYEVLAFPLSLMSQAVGTVGLLLVPVGLSWLVLGAPGRQRGFAIAALVTSSIVGLAVCVAGLVSGGFLLALGALASGILVVASVASRLTKSPGAPSILGRAIPLSMVVVPVAVALVLFVLSGRVSEFSRSRAIRNSAELIADIERYRNANGHYPDSLLSVWEDYLPGVIGIKEYLYEPRGDAYNLVFENVTYRIGTREIVVYNPTDDQVMTSHKNDRLRLTPDQLRLDQTRGHYAVLDAKEPHWKYYWFD
jgi:hypothetical protein